MTVYYIVCPLFSFVSTMDIENVETMQMFIMEFFLGGGGYAPIKTHSLKLLDFQSILVQTLHKMQVLLQKWAEWTYMCGPMCLQKQGFSMYLSVGVSVFNTVQRNDCKCMKTHLGFLEEVLFGYLSYRVQVRTKILISHSYCLSSQGWLML